MGCKHLYRINQNCLHEYYEFLLSIIRVNSDILKPDSLQIKIKESQFYILYFYIRSRILALPPPLKIQRYINRTRYTRNIDIERSYKLRN